MSDEHYIREVPRCSEQDRQAVTEFAEGMINKLSRNSHKAHWSEASIGYLFKRLQEEVQELAEAIESGDVERIIDECRDCGNFYMMIADNACGESGGQR